MLWLCPVSLVRGDDISSEANLNYIVAFDGNYKQVLNHPCQGSSCYGSESNNLASFTMVASGSPPGPSPLPTPAPPTPGDCMTRSCVGLDFFPSSHSWSSKDVCGAEMCAASAPYVSMRTFGCTSSPDFYPQTDCCNTNLCSPPSTFSNVGTSNTAAEASMEGSSGKYKPVRVEVTSLKWSTALGMDANIRPSYLQEDGIIGKIDKSSLAKGKLAFTVYQPCQLSVEVGEEAQLLSTMSAFHNFDNLILSFNPPESEFPHQKPKLLDANTCESMEAGRSCVLGATRNSCAPLTVQPYQDMYFTSARAKSYLWGGGCGNSPKQILLRNNARVFLDEDVIIYARIISNGALTSGLYGYGYISNQYMHGTQDYGIANTVNLYGPGSTVWGITVLGSTYRNIQVGGNSLVAWTKSFAWNDQTDCVNIKSPGTRVLNNFFKNNDDCLKGYQTNSYYANNVLWHKTVGRSLMLSWGNLNEANDLDSSVHYVNTSIIHDELAYMDPYYSGGWSNTSMNGVGVPEALYYQAKMMYYSTLINAQHSPNNVIGTASSPVLIENLHLEGQISSVMLLTNGYINLDNKASWMGQDGCTGNINIKISNLDLRKVTRYRTPSVAGGCYADSNYPSIPNADCICKSSMRCPADRSCKVAVEFDGVTDPNSTTPDFASMFIAGDNLYLRGIPPGNSTPSIVV